jgi:hypothetical protein
LPARIDRLMLLDTVRKEERGEAVDRVELAEAVRGGWLEGWLGCASVAGVVGSEQGGVSSTLNLATGNISNSLGPCAGPCLCGR